MNTQRLMEVLSGERSYELRMAAAQVLADAGEDLYHQLCDCLGKERARQVRAHLAYAIGRHAARSGRLDRVLEVLSMPELEVLCGLLDGLARDHGFSEPERRRVLALLSRSPRVRSSDCLLRKLRALR